MSKININDLKSLLEYREGRLYWRRDKARAKKGEEAGCVTPKGYRRIRIMGSVIMTHRAVWAISHGKYPKNYIDHINGDKADNRIENLRDFTKSQNSKAFQSRRISGSSEFRGVYYLKRNRKFKATLQSNLKKYHLGLFSEEIDAARAYDRAAISHGFDIQALNFKPEEVEDV